MSNDDNRDVCVDITIRFYKKDPSNDSWLRKAIRWWTESKYHHVDIIVNDLLSSADYTGIMTIPVDSRDLAYAPYDAYHVSHIIPKARLRDTQRFMHHSAGSRYDYTGIFLTQILNSRIEDSGKWFCSELTSEILCRLVPDVYGDMLDKTYNLVSPGDLAVMFNMEERS